MTDLRQAALQALKALEVLSKLGNGGTDGNSVGNTIAQEAREHLFTALAQPEQQAEPVSMRMPKVGDRVICLEDESLGEVVSLTGGGSPDITFDDGTRGTYLLREFAELFGYVAAPLDKTNFNEWWDSYRHDPANPFAEGSAAYWAWAGWQAAQRPWVGLEAEDLAQIESDEFWQVGNHMAIAMAVEAKLKERNNG